MSCSRRVSPSVTSASSPIELPALALSISLSLGPSGEFSRVNDLAYVGASSANIEPRQEPSGGNPARESADLHAPTADRGAPARAPSVES